MQAVIIGKEFDRTKTGDPGLKSEVFPCNAQVPESDVVRKRRVVCVGLERTHSGVRWIENDVLCQTYIYIFNTTCQRTPRTIVAFKRFTKQP